ncbi:MAG: hypothetical protein JNM56_28310 [Planctomycetia bacterium]|nr:hypothetical protein [Planctomycetia bacterium]
MAAIEATSQEELTKLMMLYVRPDDQFKPTALYDPDGDCIEFLAKPDTFYAERVDDIVTVYYSQETKEVIGSLIKGVSRFCREFSKKNPGFRIVIEDGPVRLVHLFQARFWSVPQDAASLKTITYQKLMEVAGETIVEGDLKFAA